jgi:hypothetical protein
MDTRNRIHDMCIAYATVKLRDLLPKVSESYPNPSEAAQYELESFHKFYRDAQAYFSSLNDP